MVFNQLSARLTKAIYLKDDLHKVLSEILRVRTLIQE